MNVVSLNSRRWTLAELQLAKACSREAETHLVKVYGKSRLESDLARWTLLGRSYEEAISILNGQGHGGERYPAVVAQ